MSATANIPKLIVQLNLMQFLADHPADTLLYIAVVIGLMSFIGKFARDVIRWFSTGLSSKDI